MTDSRRGGFLGGTHADTNTGSERFGMLRWIQNPGVLKFTIRVEGVRDENSTIFPPSLPPSPEFATLNPYLLSS